MKIIIIGTYPPTECGIATFTYDFYQSINKLPNVKARILAIANGSEPSFPSEVVLSIDKEDLLSYSYIAQYINTHFDICILQHEYGIFGGLNGSYILDLINQLQIPLYSNLHTLLNHPNKYQRFILNRILAKSHIITVMTPYAVDLLTTQYTAANKDKIRVIQHGVPEFNYTQVEAKKLLGFSNQFVILSFGFLGRGKGIETVLEALKQIKDQEFIYIILGRTHPNVLKYEGEKYRLELQQQVEQYNLQKKVLFINEFASSEVLDLYLSACDTYITAYPNEQQISSGTLSFALGAGAALISTPYWYARDLLAQNRGILFDFGDSVTLSKKIQSLMKSPTLLQYYRNKAKNYGRKMSWKSIGSNYISMIQTHSCITYYLN